MRILLASHHFLPRHRGGVEVHTWRVARGLLAAGEDVLVVCTDDDPLLPPGAIAERELDGVPVVALGHPRLARSPEDTLGLPAVGGAFEQVLDRHRPDVVHFQHLMYLGLDAPRRVKQRHVPCVLTLHEYWLLCARGGQLLMADGTRCAGPLPETCGRCLSNWRFGRSPEEVRIARWCERVRRALGWNPFPLLKRLRGGSQPRDPRVPEAAAPGMPEFLERRAAAVSELRTCLDRVLCPSRFLMETFQAAGWPAELLRHWPNGIEPVRVAAAPRPDAGRQPPPLRIAFMGAVSFQKGLQILARAQRRMCRGTAELHVHGDVRFDPAYWARVQGEAAAEEFHVHGPYRPGDVGRILAGADVVVVPSVWFENAPLVISEARAARVPVVASGMGGMAEMVRDGVDGRTFRPGDAEDLARVLGELAADRAELRRLAAAAPRPRLVEQEVADLRRLYADLIEHE